MRRRMGCMMVMMTLISPSSWPLSGVGAGAPSAAAWCSSASASRRSLVLTDTVALISCWASFMRS
ncbi:hypothetical protein EYF80_048506 [Liparis tanakae]|uniref:Secreted protein n=1 Tax=Liparis tanakae TaxID=230148 RepID=A0A4Z2FM29_9TELE|nr:hypothetical protein EYF80_048506 [Liparis tanakae]